MSQQQRIVVTVTGPSGGGKTELVKRLVETEDYAKVVSMTTRLERPGEENGVDYYFVSPTKFVDLDLVEHTFFHGSYYGVSVEELDRIFALGKIPVVILDPVGVESWKALEQERGFKLYSVFVTANVDILEHRFKARMGVAAEEDLTRGDQERFKAIAHEASLWEDMAEWDTVYVNNSNSINDLDWFVQDLDNGLIEFGFELEDQAKGRDNGSQG
jgi:guanylate kinase